jgi:hypothetical protein
LSWIAFFAEPPLIGVVPEHMRARLTFDVALRLAIRRFLLAPILLGQPKSKAS